MPRTGDGGEEGIGPLPEALDPREDLLAPPAFAFLPRRRRSSASPGSPRTMSHQRVRRNGSPTPATSLGGGGAAAAGGGAGASSRLQPMRATVPFQLKQQQQQQHGSPTRSGGGGASAPGGGLPRAAPASRSISPTRAAPTGSGGRGGPAMATQTPGGGGSSSSAAASAAAASSRGSPTRAGGARGSPPRPHHLPPSPPPGCGLSPCSSPLPPLPEGSATVAGRVRHRRHSPEQGRSSPERKSPSSPVCKGERSCQL